MKRSSCFGLLALLAALGLPGFSLAAPIAAPLSPTAMPAQSTLPGPARWIVEFNAPSSAQRLSEGVGVLRAREALQDNFTQLQADLTALAASAAARGSEAPAIVWRYRDCLAGAAVQADAETAEALRSKPYVAAVHPDGIEELFVVAARQIARIDEAVEAFGVFGDGIRVAIIDTGIDYNHPGLGGGIGPGYRILGGFDFHNNDNDPLDDHGHGTGVAGIIGSSDPVVTGVAPHCQFLALKAFGPNGGLLSNVLAAMEYAADPDQDPSTDDAAHVINYSAGTIGGGPDDLTSRAATNLVELGIVFCAAVGNAGSIQGAIASPSVARAVIGVGSLTNPDRISFFSSRGPSYDVYEVKPDLIAKGESMFSTLLNNGVGIIGSGTSFSTPVVAGAAALMRQLHPDWTPDMVKASMMNSAFDAGHPPPVQGAGYLDLLPAMQAPFVAEPGMLGLGINNLEAPVWTARRAIKIHNVIGQTITVNLRIDAEPKPGIKVSIQPESVVVPPLSVAKAVFEIEVDNRVAPLALEYPHSHHGAVRIETGPTSSRIPYSFVSYPELRVSTDLQSWDIRLLSSSGQIIEADGRSDEEFSRLVGPGLYDFAALSRFPDGQSGILVEEDMPISGLKNVRLEDESFPLRYTIAATGAQGEPLDLGTGFLLFKHDETILFEDKANFSAPFRFGPLGERSKFEWRVDRFVERKTLYQLNGTITGGLQGDRHLEIGPQDYRRFRARLHELDLAFPFVGFGPSMVRIDPNTGEVLGRFESSQSRLVVNPPFQFSYYFTPPGPEQEFRYTQFHLFPRIGLEPAFSSALIDESADPPLRVAPGPGATPFAVIAGEDLHIGRGPFVFTGRIYDRGSRQFERHWSGFDSNRILFSGPDGGFMRLPILLSQLAGANFEFVVFSRERVNGEPPGDDASGLGNSAVRMEFTSENLPLLEGERGASFAQVDYTFDTAARNPPYIKRLEILDGGMPTQRLRRSGDNRIRLEVASEIAEIASVAMSVRWEGGAIPLIVAEIGQQSSNLLGKGRVFETLIPDLPESRTYDLYLEVSDTAGNILRLTQSVAFHYRLENSATRWAEYP